MDENILECSLCKAKFDVAKLDGYYDIVIYRVKKYLSIGELRIQICNNCKKIDLSNIDEINNFLKQ